MGLPSGSLRPFGPIGPEGTRSQRSLIIAIDGPAGSGKSSTAKVLAKRLKIPFIDTGAMYRAVTWKAMQEGVDFSDKKRLVAIAKKAKIRFVGAHPRVRPIERRPNGRTRGSASTDQRVLLNGRDITEEIRLPQLTQNVFYIAQEPLIRRELVAKQRELGLKRGGVMEGRDIGTVVFPDADYKFYFDADLKIRTKRRMKDLMNANVGAHPRVRPIERQPNGRTRGSAPTLNQVRQDIQERDRHDKTRSEGPLRCAKDAFRIDTSSLTIDQTVDKILSVIRANPLKSSPFRKKQGRNAARGT